ncbi:MAG: DUF922 domain-containing protein [Flavobacteriales bacterium]|nr:DUF922 domain-containing protein [Flavobacteriales bacterium]MCB9448089.1 DUF922 domain-containing protein [Flavobacteriales bacterium]
MKWLLALICTLSTLLPAHAQEVDSVLWSAARPLTWDDFKGPVPENTAFKALTDYKISFKGHVDPNRYTKKGSKQPLVVYDVICQFNTNNSWVVKGSETDVLLKHEQTHFDIAEWHARDLRKKLAELDPDEASGGRAVTKLFQLVSRECRAIQDRYDRETDHGVNAEKQKEWESKVSKELKKLDKYAL